MTDSLVLGDVPVSVWDDFHAGKLVTAPELGGAWSRARDLGAPMLGAPAELGLVCGGDLREHVERVELVRAIGQAVLDRAAARVADLDFLLLVADADGVVVHTSGGGDFARTASDVRLIAGANWSEASRGTNAIGTAVAANRPTEVHGHAHFGRSYHQLVCYAAPVRGLDGKPIAVVDATSRIECADPMVARVVTDAAQALEQLIRLNGYATAGASVARTLGRSLDRMRDPALFVEAPGRLVRANTAARELIGGAGLRALGVDWARLVREAVMPTHGGMPIVVGANRRAWRMRVEPIASAAGEIIAAMVVLEPGRITTTLPIATIAAQACPTQRHTSEPFETVFRLDAAVEAAVTWSRKLAATDLPIVLLAETGTGKELFARAIHDTSPRANGPWHAVNCGALAPSLLEAELFGYAPGAFTGADRDGRSGLFHAATGGTLFLDEVAEMSPPMQAALLRVVETNTYRRVGDTRLEHGDVRIVCATCRDLASLVAAGTFRSDLYYRLKGAVVTIPPLRDRTDIVELAELFLVDATLSPSAAEAVRRYAWPGNVRELKSMLAVAKVVAAGSPVIELDHLPVELGIAEIGEGSSSLGRAERDTLVRALAEAGGNASHAAKALGIARSTLHRMKRRHGLA